MAKSKKSTPSRKPVSNVLAHAPADFAWGLFPEAESAIFDLLEEFMKRCEFARHLAQRLYIETATLFRDWVDFIVVIDDEAIAKKLARVGFVKDENAEVPKGLVCLWHPHTTLPRVLVGTSRPGKKKGKGPARSGVVEVAIKPESVTDTTVALGAAPLIEGAPYSRFRRGLLYDEGDIMLTAVERLGYRGFVPKDPTGPAYRNVLEIAEAWRLRPRHFENQESEGFEFMTAMAREAVRCVGSGIAATLFFRGEREFWNAGNTIGSFQKAPTAPAVPISCG
jgi:hypothetical protein